jgi:hypothetical protein
MHQDKDPGDSFIDIVLLIATQVNHLRILAEMLLSACLSCDIVGIVEHKRQVRMTRIVERNHCFLVQSDSASPPSKAWKFESRAIT